MNIDELTRKFHEIASSPKKQLEHYLSEGKKVVTVAPVYTPEEIIHSMGMVPMGVWGADMEINGAKKYFPAFICSVMQTILELGMRGEYKGVSAIVIPSLCDSLKVLGQNWKAAVKDIPFIPMSYPQNRQPSYGIDFTRAGYERVIRDLEEHTGAAFSPEKLKESIRIYNEHNEAMRLFDEAASVYPISAEARSDVFKSAWFIRKEEHTALVRELTEKLKKLPKDETSARIMVSGILADSPHLLKLFDDNHLKIAADDVAAWSRQYRTDTPDMADPLDALAHKFADMKFCTLLYDPEKKRVDYIVSEAKERKAKGIVVLMTKFCDPEEFDYVPIKRACEKAGLMNINIEVDRQMVNFEQAATMLEAFREM
jgi:benzoyl-CoA reductase/2-hydroxyglutaryl-CoA dehydratase subunit BcrC/BadD/HgdB